MSDDRPYRLLPFSHENLCSALSNSHTSLEVLLGEDKTRYLSDYLVTLGAKTLVVEHDYVDGDYLDDFSKYYAKCFQSYARKCQRLHFFAVEITDTQLQNAIDGELDSASTERIREGYLGFVVARPLPDAVIGRTILKTYPPDSGRRHYTCTRSYNSNLFGLELTVRSLPFQEQDNVLAACATVALWCSFHKTAELFGTPIPTPAQITSSANEVVHHTRPVPSHGLNIQQICNAIRSVGLDAEVVIVNSNLPVASLAYAHLCHGLPVILIATIEGVGRHAIALTGYSINPAPVMTCEVDPKAQSIPMTGLRINEFYGHDDQIGPFCRVVIKPSASIGTTTYPVVFESSWKDKKSGKFLTIYPEMVVIPVYHKIRVTFVDVQTWITRLHAVVNLFLKSAGRLEWDLRLITVNDYKKSLRDSKPRDPVRRQLLVTGLPKYMWRASLHANGTELMECLVDATDMMQSAPFQIILWHSDTLKDEVHKALVEPSLRDVLRQVLTPHFAEMLIRKTG
jgi:hypothetical protein